MAKSKTKARILPFFLLSLIAVVIFEPIVSAQHVGASPPQVGAFYYVWYDPAQAISWEYPKIQDKPVLGYYNSCDPFVIEQHFAWLSDLHIDFIAVSWWGMYNQSDWHSFQNNATSTIFQVARQNVTNVKVALMVEPFNETGSYNYAEVYDWVYSLYQQYPTVYYRVYDKPLLCFFNGENMTSHGFPRDDRFTVKIVGNDPTAEWLYNPLQDYVEPLIRDRQVSVIPRFDDFYVRSPNITVDSKLEYLYVEQWKHALNLTKKNAIDFVTITSWNEFPERSAIEPHYDATASNHDSFYLYNMTKAYVEELKGINQVVSYDAPHFWYQNSQYFVGIIAILLICVLVAIEIYKHS